MSLLRRGAHGDYLTDVSMTCFNSGVGGAEPPPDGVPDRTQEQQMNHSIVITIRPIKLDDASKVYDVVIGRPGEPAITLPCVTGKDADALAAKLIDALAAHTNETTDFGFVV